MDFEQGLRMTIALLGSCHVLGCESETFSKAMSNLKNMAEALKRGKEKRGTEDGHHDRDEPGKDV